jgi:hypothetical protein
MNLVHKVASGIKFAADKLWKNIKKLLNSLQHKDSQELSITTFTCI